MLVCQFRHFPKKRRPTKRTGLPESKLYALPISPVHAGGRRECWGAAQRSGACLRLTHLGRGCGVRYFGLDTGVAQPAVGSPGCRPLGPPPSALHGQWRPCQRSRRPCRRPPTSAPPAASMSAERGGILRASVPYDVFHFDPHRNGATPALMFFSNVFEHLAAVDPNKRDEIAGQIATKWDSSGDGTEWTYTIRQGIQWHDGEALGADDVVKLVPARPRPAQRHAHWSSEVHQRAGGQRRAD